MLLVNYSAGFLAAQIDLSATTITVNPGHSLPTAVGSVFTAIIWNSTGYASPAQDPNAEIVLGQYFSLNTYTITRGKEGTAPVAHLAGALIGLYITAGVLALPYVKVSETEPLGTGGGEATTGSWVTRVLNTTDSDFAGISSLASNQITLPAGTYKVCISSPSYNGLLFQARLQNITAATTLLIGTSVAASVNATEPSVIVGLITLTVPSALAVQYQANTRQDTNDLGKPCSFGTEVYTVAEFTMINT